MLDVGWVPLIIGVFILFGWSVLIVAIVAPHWKRWMKELRE